VLGLAVGLFVVEFVADKIPYVDSMWDAVHTFIRPPAAAFLSYSAFAGGIPEQWKIGAALLAGSVALTSHGAKATTRAAANVSPEPVSNWTLSVAEDSIAVFLAWLAAAHPLLTAAVVAVLMILAVLLIWRLIRFFRQVVARFGRRPIGPEPAATPEARP
jgi:ABC-type xylose transport system permease subunit